MKNIILCFGIIVATLFLFGPIGIYIGNSIFNVAERCRNYYNKHYVNDYSIAYELYSSEAGKIIKNLGFPCCLEELIIKMDLMGI